jgi:hypothetical protein
VVGVVPQLVVLKTSEGLQDLDLLCDLAFPGNALSNDLGFQRER